MPSAVIVSNALDYLLKPISYVDFLQAANKALQWFELVQKPEEIDSIFVKSDYKLVQVDLKENHVYRRTERLHQNIYGRHSQTYPVTDEYEKPWKTLAISRFIRVHHSFIVQKDKIRVIDRGRIVFDKTYIPIAIVTSKFFRLFLTKGG